MLNRSAVVMRPAQPYLDWARSVSRDGDGVAPGPHDEQTVWLVPEIEDENECDEVLQAGWQALFANMLGEWSTLESEWPQNRTYEMFREWFEIDVHSMVIDLVDGPLSSEGM